jgi:nitrogen-specific signal transduction histidine kinase/CheY-like chemotaxis protein
MSESDLAKLEERLQRTAKLESLGILAGGIAHDFNNLLTGILANATLALDDAPAGSSQAEALRYIVQAGERAAELTQQILAWSGKDRFRLEYVDLSGLVTGILILIETALARKTALNLHIARDLPSIEAAPAQLQQIVMNLVINASESIEGMGEVSVRTGVAELDGTYHEDDALPDPAPRGQYIFLEVRDTGQGMDPGTRQRIFDPFFSTKFTGRGLGLAAVLGIVRGHRGSIRVASAPGRGTAFTVYFPACARPVTWPTPYTAPGRASGSGIVLVVDDEEYVRNAARRTLDAAGYTVVCASSGAEAIQLFQALATQIEAAIVDLTMLGTDGVEVARRCRHLAPRLKVIATSGYPEAEVKARFGDLMDVFLPKPYRSEQLRELVHSVIAG